MADCSKTALIEYLGCFRYDIVSIGENVQTFRKSYLPPFSGPNLSRTLASMHNIKFLTLASMRHTKVLTLASMHNIKLLMLASMHNIKLLTLVSMHHIKLLT
jgi:hypothetical protein